MVSFFFDPDIDPVDLLAGVHDLDELEFEAAAADETDSETAAAMRVLLMIDEAYAAGKPDSRIPCPFCGQALRYQKDEHGKLAECPAGDFVCLG